MSVRRSTTRRKRDAKRSGARARSRGSVRGPTLRELADRRAIEDVVIAYGHALDSRDYGRLRECFLPDAQVQYGDSNWLRGPEEAGRYCARVLDPLDASQHRLGTILVKVAGNRATSTTYLCAEHLRAGARFTVGGSYLDEWERTRAGWRIARRRLVTTWVEGDASLLGDAPLGPAAR